MAYSADDLATLERALASPEKIVRFGQRWIEFRTVAEIQAAIASIQSSIETTGGTRTRQIRMSTQKGF